MQAIRSMMKLASWGSETAAMLIAVSGFAWACGAQESPEPAPKDPLQAEGERLERLGYVDWSDDLDEQSMKLSGVVRYDPSRSQPGLNFYTTRKGRVDLLDASGEVVHQWVVDGDFAKCQVAHLLPGGDILALLEAKGLVRLDWDSNVIWSREINVHHDLSLDTDGNIYALTAELPSAEKARPGIYPVIVQGVVVVSAGGELLRSFVYNALFPEAEPEFTAEAIEAYVKVDSTRRKKSRGESFLDTLHSNSVSVLPRDVPGLGKLGDLLVSIRRTNTIALLDGMGQKVKWRWGPGEIVGQHHPNLLDNGCLLIFDNGEKSRGASRIVEYCPREKRITWEYRGTKQEPFFSVSRGSVQRLDNDNIFVTESDSGRVFEVTRGGDVVWEWFSPVKRQRGGTAKRGVIYRMTRISGELLDSLPLAEN